MSDFDPSSISDRLSVLGIGVIMGLALAFRALMLRFDDDDRGREVAAANTLRELRTAQMVKVLHLFQKARGRPPQTKDELAEIRRR